MVHPVSEARFDKADIPAHWTPAVRVDVGRLRKVERTPSGGVRVPGAIARTGVLEYLRADGTRVLEYVPPDEVRRLESLATLRDAVVTVAHPDGGTRMVSPATYRQDSVGHVSGDPSFDGEHVVAALAILDADAIGRIDAGELVELSAGYRCLIDPTPGMSPEGHRYDQVQRHREYNHVALLPRGGGRAGETVSLRLDGEDQDAAVQVRTADPQTPPARPAPAERIDAMETERIDGIDYKVGSPEWRQAIARMRTRADEEMAELEEEKKKTDGDIEALKAERDDMKKKLDELEKKLAEMEDPERTDALVAKRLDLFERARAILGLEAKLDGKKELDIMRETLAKDDPELKLEGRSDEYVRVRFELATDRARKERSGSSPITEARRDAFAPPPAAPANGGAYQSPHCAGREPPVDISRRYQRQ